LRRKWTWQPEMATDLPKTDLIIMKTPDFDKYVQTRQVILA
jgi:hypothetical protein